LKLEQQDHKHAWLTGAVVLASMVVFVGCPQTSEPTDDGGSNLFHCEVREDCDPGQICTTEKYCSDCESSGQCRLKEECKVDEEAGTQRCGLRAGWGEQCQRNDACNAGQWCVQGLCQNTEDVRLCPGGKHSECASGQRCNAVNLVCEEDLGCAETADCSPGEVCNTGSHTCVPKCTPDTEADVCAGGERCVNELCVQCTSNEDCGPGLICDGAGKCAAQDRCYQDRDCKVPLVCYVPTGSCVQKPPPCVSDENCEDDQRCDIGRGRCIPRACQPDMFEPNEDRETARPMTQGTYTGLTLCEGDRDFYSFNLARGDRLAINVNADPFAENTFSTVVQDATGRTLAAGRLLVDYTASSADTYYVAISTTDLIQPYDVIFFFTRGEPCTDDGFEPNDTAASATPLNSAGTIDGAICPQDKDHFRVTVPAGQGLKVSLENYTATNGLLKLCVFEGSTELGCSEDPRPQVTVPAATAGGKALVMQVSAVDPRSANTYTARVEFQ